jgi:hypothetical protein
MTFPLNEGDTEGSDMTALYGQKTIGARPTNTRSDTFAQDTNAWITRQQWQDYQNRYLPVENKLIDQTMGRDLLNERLGAITATTNTAFDTNMLAAQQRRARYGMRLEGQGAQAQQRGRELSQATAIADGTNNTRTHIYDRNMDTIAGGSSAINQAIR